MKTTTIIAIAVVVLVVGSFAFTKLRNPNAAAEAWAAGSQNPTTGPFGYRWNGSAWVRTEDK